MSKQTNSVARLGEHLHHHLLWYVLGTYVLAAIFPYVGLAIRHIDLFAFEEFNAETIITAPAALLAVLLFNAGLGIRIKSLIELTQHPAMLVVGFLANITVPIAFILAISVFMLPWHNPTEVQYILVGLALIASMPIAGSSSAWSQNADGDVALSLGLVVFSTCLSPVTTPVALHAASWMANDIYAELLQELASQRTGVFLTLLVFLPSVLGIAIRYLLNDRRWEAIKSGVKLLNTMALLILIYSNASLALPQAIAKPDWDFFFVLAGILVFLCSVTFGSGWIIAKRFRAGKAQRTSLMFGLGMNNNGTAMVLVSSVSSQLPEIMLSIIFYNLLQHFAAGIVDRWYVREPLAQKCGA